MTTNLEKNKDTCNETNVCMEKIISDMEKFISDMRKIMQEPIEKNQEKIRWESVRTLNRAITLMYMELPEDVKTVPKYIRKAEKESRIMRKILQKKRNKASDDSLLHSSF